MDSTCPGRAMAGTSKQTSDNPNDCTVGDARTASDSYAFLLGFFQVRPLLGCATVRGVSLHSTPMHAIIASVCFCGRSTLDSPSHLFGLRARATGE